MDHQGQSRRDAPPAYVPQSSTRSPPPAPQGSSQESPLLIDQEPVPPLPLSDLPMPPSPSPPPAPSVLSTPSQEVLRQTVRPTQSPTRPHRVVPLITPADRISWAPSLASVPADPSSSAPSPSSRSRPTAASYLSVQGRRKLLQISRSVSAPKIRERAVAAAAGEAMRMDASNAAGAAQKERERRETQERLRHLLAQTSPDEDECRSVLQTCAEACAARDVDFAALLQEPIMVGHLPVYWAIIKSRAASAVRPQQDADALILTILDFSRPLQSESVTAVRRGCMTVSDNVLFRHLCTLFTEFAPPVSDTDELLLEGSGVEDSIVVEEQRGNDGAFTARIKLGQFLLRMRSSKLVYVEFVTRDRIWCLTFSDVYSSVSAEKWPWLLTLQLGEHSSPVWVDARLVITRTGNPPVVPTTSGQSTSISIPLKCHWRQLQPLSTRSISSVLDKSATDNLSSFVDASGALNARIEVKLAKSSDDGCVIC